MASTFLERVWYFAGWADRLEEGMTSEVLLADQSIAVYRKVGGEVAAVGNRCPHKFAPLHLGEVKGDAIECPYHGLQFSEDGSCVFSPHHGGAVPRIHVASYPIVERHGALWIWMSHDIEPDDALIPDLSELVDAPPSVVLDIPTMDVAGNHMLIADNLFDPAHADFVHRGRLGNGGHCGNKPAVTTTDRTVESVWTWQGAGPVPFLNQFMPDQDRIETWLKCTFHAPGIIRLENGVKPLGGSDEESVAVIAFHIVMPRTETRTTYDVRSIRTAMLDDLELTKKALALATKLFNEEDRPMIEEQQRLMGDKDFWELGPALFPTDTASAAVRRKMLALLKAESEEKRLSEAA